MSTFYQDNRQKRTNHIGAGTTQSTASIQAPLAEPATRMSTQSAFYASRDGGASSGAN